MSLCLLYKVNNCFYKSIILIPFYCFFHLTSRTSCCLSFPPRSLAISWCLVPSLSLGSGLSVWTLHYLVKLHFGTWSISTHSQDDLTEFYSFKYHLSADDSQIHVSSLDPDLGSRWFSPPVCWVIFTLPPHLASPMKYVQNRTPNPCPHCHPSKLALPPTFSSVVNGNWHFRITDSSLSLNLCIQSFSKSWKSQVYIQTLLVLISCLWP